MGSWESSFWVGFADDYGDYGDLLASLAGLFNREFWEFWEFLLLKTHTLCCYWVGFADDYGDSWDSWDFLFGLCKQAVFRWGLRVDHPCGMGERGAIVLI